jgi:hypothetical protein
MHSETDYNFHKKTNTKYERTFDFFSELSHDVLDYLETKNTNTNCNSCLSLIQEEDSAFLKQLHCSLKESTHCSEKMN